MTKPGEVFHEVDPRYGTPDDEGRPVAEAKPVEPDEPDLSKMKPWEVDAFARQALGGDDPLRPARHAVVSPFTAAFLADQEKKRPPS